MGPTLTHAFVEGVNRNPELQRIAADLVQRRKPVVHVKSRVFGPLRHDRARDLLKFHREPKLIMALPFVTTAGLLEQNILDKVEYKTA